MIESLTDTINRILVDHLGLDQAPNPLDNLHDDLGADSLDTVELMMAFEEEYDLEISDEDIDRIATVQDIVDYLVSQGVPRD